MVDICYTERELKNIQGNLSKLDTIGLNESVLNRCVLNLEVVKYLAQLKVSCLCRGVLNLEVVKYLAQLKVSCLCRGVLNSEVSILIEQLHCRFCGLI